MKELQNIQSTLKAPKSQENKFGGYKYRSCEDILEAVKPILKENECSLVISDDITMVGDRIYVKATATLLKDGKEVASSTAFAREAATKKGMDEAQITGSASSYARKYALNGLFAIDDTKDLEATNPHNNEPQEIKNNSPITGEQVKVLEGLVADTGSDVEKFLEYAGAKTFEAIAAEKYAHLKSVLERKIK